MKVIESIPITPRESDNRSNKSLSADMNSTICDGNKCVYKTLPNGKWSISLDKQPVWKSRLQNVPLTYVER